MYYCPTTKKTCDETTNKLILLFLVTSIFVFIIKVAFKWEFAPLLFFIPLVIFLIIVIVYAVKGHKGRARVKAYAGQMDQSSDGNTI